MVRQPTPKHPVHGSPKNSFSSGRAADTLAKKIGTERKPAELPRTLEELEKLLKKD